MWKYSNERGISGWNLVRCEVVCKSAQCAVKRNVDTRFCGERLNQRAKHVKRIRGSNISGNSRNTAKLDRAGHTQWLLLTKKWFFATFVTLQNSLFLIVIFYLVKKFLNVKWYWELNHIYKKWVSIAIHSIRNLFKRSKIQFFCAFLVIFTIYNIRWYVWNICILCRDSRQKGNTHKHKRIRIFASYFCQWAAERRRRSEEKLTDWKLMSFLLFASPQIKLKLLEYEKMFHKLVQFV